MQKTVTQMYTAMVIMIVVSGPIAYARTMDTPAEATSTNQLFGATWAFLSIGLFIGTAFMARAVRSEYLGTPYLIIEQYHLFAQSIGILLVLSVTAGAVISISGDWSFYGYRFMFIALSPPLGMIASTLLHIQFFGKMTWIQKESPVQLVRMNRAN